MNWEEIRSRESLTAKESKYICNDLMSTGLEMERLIVENFGLKTTIRWLSAELGEAGSGEKRAGFCLQEN